MGIKFCRFRVIQKAMETVSKEEQRTIVQVGFEKCLHFAIYLIKYETYLGQFKFV